MTGKIGAALVIIMFAGCSEIAFKGDVTPVEERIVYKEWLFVPVAMRIHPLTSITHDETNDKMVLQAYIELLDCVGDATKGIGEFRLELYQVEGKASVQDVMDRRLCVSRVPLTTIEQNRQHYDDMTQAYLVRLDVSALPVSDNTLKLVAHFRDHNGGQMTTEVILSMSGSG